METEVLLLCTANQCRSVLAQALLTARLATTAPTVTVRSAGLLARGRPPRAEVIATAAELGCDVSGHRSRLVSATDLAQADLVLGMAREHVRHAVVLVPEAWPRTFTLRELVRRGGLLGPRPPGQPLAGWLAQVHRGRDRASLLGTAAQDDVADPTDGPAGAYAATAAVLDELTGQLSQLCWAADRSPGAGAG
jgi:protein-tyrosine phosphatase